MDLLCLKKFNNVTEFNNFTQQLNAIDWKIEKQLLSERMIYHSNNMVFKELKNLYLNKKLSIFVLKDEEVITWLDTLIIVRRIFSYMFEVGLLRSDLIIIMEYPLLFGNYMRTDYVIVFQNLIITIEFGMFNQDEKRKEERYTKKVQESIGHRHVLSQMLSKRTTVSSYVMIYKPEYNRHSKHIIKENIEYNNQEIKKIARFLDVCLKNEEDQAVIKQLENLENLR